jgi:hypothetical protein
VSQVDVLVRVDLDDVIDDITDSDLISAVKARGVWPDCDQTSKSDRAMLLEGVYHALRDGNLDQTIKLINPLLDEVLGRQV